MDAASQLWLGLGYCALMLLLALFFKWRLPKKINYIYGYRTRRSLINERVWEASNRYASNFFLRICLICLLLPPLLYLIIPEYGFLITIGIHTMLVISIIYYTEGYIARHFDGEGNPVDRDD